MPNLRPGSGRDQLVCNRSAVLLRGVWGPALLCAVALVLSHWNVSADEPAKESKSEPAAVQQVALFAEHPDAVASVAFLPGGKGLATGTYEMVKLWDLAE